MNLPLIRRSVLCGHVCIRLLIRANSADSNPKAADMLWKLHRRGRLAREEGSSDVLSRL